jgi:hypothetical protein
MTLLCLLLAYLTHGFHPAITGFLDSVSGGHFTRGISSLGNGFHYPVDNNQMPTTAFLCIHAVLCLLSVVPLAKVKRGRTEHPDSGNSQLFAILLFALIFRVTLIFSVPIHENDFQRYLWDGKVAAAGINPYLFEPGAIRLHEQGIVTPYLEPNSRVPWRGREFSDGEKQILTQLTRLRDENPTLYGRIGHKAVPTVYPPLAQALFSMSNLLFGDSLIGLKAILVFFDALVILVIIGILRRLELNSAWVAVYAWSPLVLKEFANSAHYDAVPLFFTLLAIYAALGKKRQFTAAIALALGTLAKFFSAILFPVLIPLRLSHWRSFALFAALILAAYLPFFFWNNAGIRQVFAGLGVYNEHWQYNAGLFALIQQTFAQMVPAWSASLLPAKIVVALILLVILFRQSVRPGDGRQGLVHRCFVVIATLFVLSPTAFPWYYTLVMPFLCVFPKRPWIMLSWLLPLSYLDFHTDTLLSRSLFWHIPALSWIIWGTFALLLVVDSIQGCLCKSRAYPS